MSTIQLQLRSMAAAEESIAEIWMCLEEYDIPSPGMYFKFHDGGQVTIGMHIDDPVAANTVLARISPVSRTVREGSGAELDSMFQLLTEPRQRHAERAVASFGSFLAATACSESSYFVSRFKRK